IGLEALLASLDGRVALRAHGAGTDPDALGAEVADQLLDARGGHLLLDDAVLASLSPRREAKK
ncbi:MAG: hypothetical protein ACRDY4_14220, partial [Acidimicrobiia bacterium]